MCTSTHHGSACSMLVTLLYGLEPYMDDTEESSFLQDMLMVNSLHVLIKLHERLQRFGAQKPAPIQDDAEQLAREVMKELHTLEARPEISELMHLLSKPHVQDLLSVHDTVAQKDYEPKLPPLAAEDDEDEEDSVRIIQLLKSKEPLGATIKRDETTGAIVVARIMRGGAADRSGLIHEGDELREINGVPMEDKNPEEIIPILAQSDGAVTFKVIPGTKDELEADDTEVFVRALFDYNPKEDPAIPCKDAGLEFGRGDVLQIMSQEDDTWWQARRIGDANFRAGLIPSRQLQERRVALQRPEVLFQTSRALKINAEEDADYVAIHGIHIAGLRRSFRLSKKDRRSQEMQAKWKKCEADGENHISSYQEVVPYVREPGEPYRLVLLAGPSGVGLTELKRKLLLSDPEHFGVAVPHTTRERRRHEREGVDYHFVSKHAFEKDILDQKFIEYGRHGGNYYGTSLDSVRKVLAESKVCLLDVEPHAVKLLYTTEFKPYVTFVKPPAIEQLRLSRRKVKILASCDEPMPTRTFMEADFEDMINTAQDMEDKYGYLFEKIIINDDLAMAFTEIRADLKKLEKESNWIPKIWA
ncbi:MAGUK p55 subfamily member 7 isoform X1 [Pangasianodon hypophthalmus]|uniref:MAGUK p55 subfamily member 7 isoform X1 n=2 Tax=Pangasianodon hypophthalmus TaxID=310915 RepID=UPI002307874E|nr:MAGUK p55 subfamily member 7 isoform X1 [Pangasianodon hypophthalmus]